ncbi:hypothetical protein C0J52_09292 [Blattella germanica]|nr:hypothetical protein C0J52_09292 [Blattella germanica]
MYIMDAAGVLVSCSVGEKSREVKCSGIILDGGWVITTGSVLSFAIQNQETDGIEIPWEHIFKKSYSESLIRIEKGLFQNSHIAFSVICNTLLDDEGKNRISAKSDWKINPFVPVWKKIVKYIPKNQESRDMWNFRKSESYFATVSAQNMCQKSSDILKEYKASLRYVWRSSCMSEAIDTLLSSWLLGTTSSDKENNDVEAESEIAKQLLPLLLIFKLDGNESEGSDVILKMLHDLFVDKKDSLKRGRTVVVQSTPFGNPFFYNSISEGIVSNISGPKNCLILTDARTAIGSEGGPIYAMSWRQNAILFPTHFLKITSLINGEVKSDLVGMVICSLCWWKGEWVGFTLGVSLKSAVHDLLQLDGTFQNIQTLMPSSNSIKELGFLDECLVVVRCGHGWGSGVVIDSNKGVILTCSHVVRKVCIPISF